MVRGALGPVERYPLPSVVTLQNLVALMSYFVGVPKIFVRYPSPPWLGSVAVPQETGASPYYAEFGRSRSNGISICCGLKTWERRATSL